MRGTMVHFNMEMSAKMTNGTSLQVTHIVSNGKNLTDLTEPVPIPPGDSYIKVEFGNFKRSDGNSVTVSLGELRSNTSGWAMNLGNLVVDLSVYSVMRV